MPPSEMNRRAFLRRLTLLAVGPLFGGGVLTEALAAPAGPPRIALVIDDFGFSRRRLETFLRLDLPLTFAVLPRLRFSVACAAAARREGHDVLLHQPMQPICGRFDPGPGALYVGDSPERLHRVLKTNIEAVPQAVGVNNHMGSLFTGSQPEIRQALEVVRDHDLFFIDSLTSHRSQAFQTARELGMSCARRNVFLDNRPTVSEILGQLERLTAVARRNGTALGLGHPHRSTAEALARFVPRWRRSGVRLVYASALPGTGHSVQNPSACRIRTP